MKFTVLVDNRPSDRLKGEWGLSFFIEHEEKKILLDFGSSDLFLENAEKSDLPVEAVDFAVLSHAHYDHSNGLEAFFAANKDARCFISSAAAENCYAKKLIFRKYIGMPKGILEKFAGRFEFVGETTELSDGVFIVPHSTPGLESIGRREMMFRKEGGKWTPDDFLHEQSLILRSKNGLVVFNSCFHGGVKNVISEVRAAFPGEDIYAVVGGLHLFNKSRAEIEAVADDIESAGIALVVTGHCTKDRAYEMLKSRLGEKLDRLYAGKSIEII